MKNLTPEMIQFHTYQIRKALSFARKQSKAGSESATEAAESLEALVQALKGESK